jgi:hypothetical protein
MPRKKLDDREQLFARVDSATVEILKRTAEECGYTYAGEGSIGQLLDAIAQSASTDSGRLILLGLLKK